VNEVKEMALAISKVILGMVVLIGGLLVLDLIVYLSATGSTFNERVAAAHSEAFDRGYAQTYQSGYRGAYREAYRKGYEKGYDIGIASLFRKEAPVRVNLSNITHRELREFLAEDKTDANRYVPGEYICFDFAAELNNRAETKGIRAAYVRIRFQEWGHAIVAFETVDRGLVFIEPQSDREVELVIGKPYPWQSAGADQPSRYDDIIVEIQVIW